MGYRKEQDITIELKVAYENIALVIIMLVGNLDDITRTVVNEA